MLNAEIKQCKAETVLILDKNKETLFYLFKKNRFFHIILLLRNAILRACLLSCKKI